MQIGIKIAPRNVTGRALEIKTTPRRGVVYSLCAKRGIPGDQSVCRVRRTPLS